MNRLGQFIILLRQPWSRRRRAQVFGTFSAVLITTSIFLLVHFSKQTSSIVSSYNPTRVCSGAFNQNLDFSNLNDNHFSVTLRDGCFSGWVYIPSQWKDWHSDVVGEAKDTWIAYWFPNDASGSSPFVSNQTYSVNKNAHEPFRLQGHGTFVFYTNQPPVSTSTSTEHSIHAPDLVKVDINDADPHICMKPDDAYYYRASLSYFKNPVFLFDAKHRDNEVPRPGNFKGTVPVCYIVNEHGVPEGIQFPQSPGGDVEALLRDNIGSMRYQPGTLNNTAVRIQMAVNVTFP